MFILKLINANYEHFCIKSLTDRIISNVTSEKQFYIKLDMKSQLLKLY